MSSLVEVARMSKSASAKRDISKELGIFLLEPENTACWRLIFVPVPLRKSTWVKRCPSDDEQCDEDKEKGKSCALTETQKEKLAYFFSHVFDMDRDDVISLQDFEGFTEVDRCILTPFKLKTQNEMFSDNRDFEETLDDLLNLNDCPEVEGSETSSDRFREWLCQNPEANGVGSVLMKDEHGFEIAAFCRMVNELRRVFDSTTSTTRPHRDFYLPPKAGRRLL
uniref:EF-hand domain-containing protein n=1 Tax=Lygus hesperus TaxID=30085 RepID=A0A0K8SRJ1_LYGHE